jgi:hypothetical protein
VEGHSINPESFILSNSAWGLETVQQRDIDIDIDVNDKDEDKDKDNVWEWMNRIRKFTTSH